MALAAANATIYAYAPSYARYAPSVLRIAAPSAYYAAAPAPAPQVVYAAPRWAPAPAPVPQVVYAAPRLAPAPIQYVAAPSVAVSLPNAA